MRLSKAVIPSPVRRPSQTEDLLKYPVKNMAQVCHVMHVMADGTCRRHFHYRNETKTDKEDNVMGSIHVKGTAQRTVDYDLTEIRICFQTVKPTAHDSSEKIMKECEEFLSILKKKGVDISKVELISDKTNVKEYRIEDKREMYYSSERSIQIRSAFDMKTVNVIRSILLDMGTNTSFNVDYSISETESIMQDLLLEALTNAKAQAEKMAKAIDKEVINLISADKDLTHHRYNNMDKYKLDYCMCSSDDEDSKYDNSNELKATSTVLNEEIYSEWEIG